MNRSLAALALALLLPAIAACGTEKEPAPESSPSASTSDEAAATSAPSESGDVDAAGPEATMKAYLEASIAKDAATLCGLFGTAAGPVRDEPETLESCTVMYRSVLEVKPDQEGWADVSTIVAESTQALEDGPSDSTLEGDLASFTYTALTEGKPVNLIRHDGEWFIKVD